MPKAKETSLKGPAPPGRLPAPEKRVAPPAARPSPPPATKSVAPVVARDIGIDVPAPKGSCDDQHCPFHGKLSVRGQSLDGVVVSARMQRTVVVERTHDRYIQKYERYEKRTRRMLAHAPPCLGLAPGHRVTMMECRPLSKTVSFVVIQNRGVSA
jgi:small subunit ribosomal protein S17